MRTNQYDIGIVAFDLNKAELRPDPTLDSKIKNKELLDIMEIYRDSSRTHHCVRLCRTLGRIGNRLRDAKLKQKIKLKK